MEAQSSDGPTDETGDVSSLDALLGAIDAADSFLRYSQEALRRVFPTKGTLWLLFQAMSSDMHCKQN